MGALGSIVNQSLHILASKVLNYCRVKPRFANVKLGLHVVVNCQS